MRIDVITNACFCIILLGMILYAAPIAAGEYSILLRPALSVPVGAQGDMFTPGGGFLAAGEIVPDLSRIYRFSVETGILYNSGSRKNLEYIYTLPFVAHIGFPVINGPLAIEGGLSTGFSMGWCTYSNDEIDMLLDRHDTRIGFDALSGLYVLFLYHLDDIFSFVTGAEYRLIMEKSTAWQTFIFTSGVRYNFNHGNNK